MQKVWPHGVMALDIRAWLGDLQGELLANTHFVSRETKPAGPFSHGLSLCTTRQAADVWGTHILSNPVVSLQL